MKLVAIGRRGWNSFSTGGSFEKHFNLILVAIGILEYDAVIIALPNILYQVINAFGFAWYSGE